jgi:predicted DNA-binding transcriptional regulator AlpA
VAESAIIQRVSPVPFEDELLDRPYVARWLGVDPETLGAWERKGKGPRPVCFGYRSIKYSRKEVQAWIDAQRNAPRPTRKRSAKPGAVAKPQRKRRDASSVSPQKAGA